MEAAGCIAAEAESCGLQPSRNDSGELQHRRQAPTHQEVQMYGALGGPATAESRAFCEMGGAATAAASTITDPQDPGHSATDGGAAGRAWPIGRRWKTGSGEQPSAAKPFLTDDRPSLPARTRRTTAEGQPGVHAARHTLIELHYTWDDFRPFRPHPCRARGLQARGKENKTRNKTENKQTPPAPPAPPKNETLNTNLRFTFWGGMGRGRRARGKARRLICNDP